LADVTPGVTTGTPTGIVIKMLKSRRIRCVEHVTNSHLENRKGSDHLGYLGINGKIILKCTLKKEAGSMWIGIMWLRIGTIGRLL
jgi:hypothetical protein